MLDASTLHDALRAEGIVPEAEDVHLMACSNRWRHALMRASDAIQPEEVDELELHMCCASEDDLHEEAERADQAEKELEKALKRTAELERALDVAQEELKDKT